MDGGHFNPRYYTVNSIVSAGVEMSNFDTKIGHFNPRQLYYDVLSYADYKYAKVKKFLSILIKELEGYKK